MKLMSVLELKPETKYIFVFDELTTDQVENIAIGLNEFMNDDSRQMAAACFVDGNKVADKLSKKLNDEIQEQIDSLKGKHDRSLYFEGVLDGLARARRILFEECDDEISS